MFDNSLSKKDEWKTNLKALPPFINGRMLDRTWFGEIACPKNEDVPCPYLRSHSDHSVLIQHVFGVNGAVAREVFLSLLEARLIAPDEDDLACAGTIERQSCCISDSAALVDQILECCA